MFPEGGFLTLTYRFRASRFSERELNTHLLVAFCSHRCEDISNSRPSKRAKKILETKKIKISKNAQKPFEVP